MKTVNVIGAGLAGCEVAFRLANENIKVNLYEQKPEKKSPAHSSDKFCELVCSNSLRGNVLSNAVGLLKEEMRMLGSLIIESAYINQVPAGGALAVDREKFSEYITKKIKSHPNINVIYKEKEEIDEDEYTVIASGPLTSDKLFSNIKKLTGSDDLYFYDAAAPIVSYDSIDMSKAFKGSRYNKGDADYINCPMTKEEYDAFYEALINSECAELKAFEKEVVFEGCMPVETMAKRGYNTLLFGPLKPVGLRSESMEKDAYAVVQLRQDNKEATMYNIVGFQTHLKFYEQKRVFSMIPGLNNAEFLRYGVMHRNTFINSPKVLDNHYKLINNDKIYFAGQITGVEGYVESAASGLLVGIYLSRLLNGKEISEFSSDTAVGALSNYISNKTVEKFQPMNINFGIINPLGYRVKGKQEKNLEISKRALLEIEEKIKNNLI
ncbi:MAG: methylenetetrahydrofolate--tRNA-(uracil(54)-C(5))-methyltransferase (FADH(2)-oxidizing) TrmFO [Ruminococcaceae bacterium]|nr:methylenetetrahydrofolate--tRNA-(uracil(54)-C(5))-methyltransferase (FADH(2)-oxidizing) TrmFO [Oscillospiraceae bacterium]